VKPSKRRTGENMANNKVTIVKNYTKTVACGQMGGLMGVIAVVLSSSMNHSFWWGVLHFEVADLYRLLKS
jgi:hypothetical protein